MKQQRLFTVVETGENNIDGTSLFVCYCYCYHCCSTLLTRLTAVTTRLSWLNNVVERTVHVVHYRFNNVVQHWWSNNGCSWFLEQEKTILIEQACSLLLTVLIVKQCAVTTLLSWLRCSTCNLCSWGAAQQCPPCLLSVDNLQQVVRSYACRGSTYHWYHDRATKAAACGRVTLISLILCEVMQLPRLTTR